jgi:hypothetical protein
VEPYDANVADPQAPPLLAVLVTAVALVTDACAN